ncbi:hypothetical protein [Saccharothrix australiensis]|uniref:RiboL-PSP-HEPN domain-containing protein n=1 Tax=Saccharothrix australiensis TaxID=2072 RepID=A0A495W0K6_9PSEU|nr:hypothetical protein [Saccharothrix australiensis]RKT54225.1 hypothetical protein C8E97_2840 [Saccharothrix australiensis]
MPDDVVETEALRVLRANMDYARGLVRGGQHLERLRVGAFDVTDLYRSAWVQAVSALDHWVKSELYDRALGLALQVSEPRPRRFLRIEVPMSLLEEVLHHSGSLEEKFRDHLRSLFGYTSFQNPEKIKEAFGYVSDVALWDGVAKRLSQDDGTTWSHQTVRERISRIMDRRNKIAHATDRDQETGERRPIQDHEATETIDWLEQLAVAISAVVGPPPVRPALTKRAWTRPEVDAAVEAIADPDVRAAGRRLLAHADERGAHVKGGAGAYPSAGLYYPVDGKRRSLVSLYISAERPELTINLRSVQDMDTALAVDVLTELRGNPVLAELLPGDSDELVRKYPSFELAVFSTAPDALDTVLRALDLVVRPDSR